MTQTRNIATLDAFLQSRGWEPTEESIRAFFAGCRHVYEELAIWKDGSRYVGVMGTPLPAVLDQLNNEEQLCLAKITPKPRPLILTSSMEGHRIVFCRKSPNDNIAGTFFGKIEEMNFQTNRWNVLEVYSIPADQAEADAAVKVLNEYDRREAMLILTGQMELDVVGGEVVRKNR